MPRDIKETHHIMVEFKDAKTGKAQSEREVKVKVQNPDKSDLSKELIGMQGPSASILICLKRVNTARCASSS